MSAAAAKKSEKNQLPTAILSPISPRANKCYPAEELNNKGSLLRRKWNRSSCILTENGQRGAGSHGSLDVYRRMLGLAGVDHLVVVGRRRYGDRTLRVVLF